METDNMRFEWLKCGMNVFLSVSPELEQRVGVYDANDDKSNTSQPKSTFNLSRRFNLTADP